VIPFRMQVARARTRPWLAGTLGSTQVPSGFTRTLRLSTLIVQFSFSCAPAGTAAENRIAAAPTRAFRNVPHLSTRVFLPFSISALHPPAIGRCRYFQPNPNTLSIFQRGLYSDPELGVPHVSSCRTQNTAGESTQVWVRRIQSHNECLDSVSITDPP